MQIFWVIIIVVAVLYLAGKSKNGAAAISQVVQSNNYSYRLDVHIEPNWGSIYEKLLDSLSNKELKKHLGEKDWQDIKDETSNLVQRRYYFTEYYDSASGLTTRLQRIIYPSGRQILLPVDEFGDRGYIFEVDRTGKKNENREASQERKKLTVDIGESYIRNDIFDKYIGGERFDYDEENYLFRFPLAEVFDFLFSLGRRFDGLEQNMIVKWPENIEKKFEDYGIKYETYFEFEPKLFNLEEHDKALFEKLGKPKISDSSGRRFQSGYLSDKLGTYYGVSLKIFRAGESERISSTI